MLKIETHFIPKNEIANGIIPERFLLPATLLAIAIFLITAVTSDLWITSGLAEKLVIVILAIIFGRLLAIDLRHYLLLDIYTIPLLISGLIAPQLLGWLTWQQSLIGAVIGFGIFFAFAYIAQKFHNNQPNGNHLGGNTLGGETLGIGGGDIKLLTACCAWLGAEPISLLIFLASTLSLILFIPLPKGKPIPFGPGICLGFWVVFLYENEIYTSLLAIFG